MGRDRRDRARRCGCGSWRAVWVALAGTALVTTWLSGAGRAEGPESDVAAGERFPPEAVEFFEARVRPVLVERCVKCHGPRKQSSGLRLDSRPAILKGGDS